MPIAVSVTGTTAHRYPEDIEVAVYFCCLEALQNAVKHGGAQAGARVRLFDREGVLCFEVSDTGGGFDIGTHSGGTGIANMRDRIEAIGGTVHIDSVLGEGTSVRGTTGAAALTAQGSAG